ncbi:EAL domain-containing protein [Ramlibacter sp. 2FC]|uniref:EAL domain-containing protein n=1 Tax=Ramlibacter sp. 2FC TaxID=2502188 RepID=UPI0010F74244|nr:EAL domain-containing protein [Ramlibacter sp. 2FC]
MRAGLSRLHIRLLMLILVSVAPAFAIIVYSGVDRHAKAVQEAHERVLASARIVAAHNQGRILHAHQLLASLARLPEVRGRMPDAACNELLAGLLKLHRQYNSMIVARRDGRVRCSGEPLSAPVNVADRPYFRRVIESMAFATGDYQVSRVTGQSNFALAHPVVDDDGTVQAVLAVGLDLGEFGGPMSELALPKGAVATLVDGHGTMLARQPPGADGAGRPLPDLEAFHALRALRRDGVLTWRGPGGVPHIVGLAQVDGAGEGGVYAYVHVDMPAQAALAEAWRIRVRDLALLGLATALMLVLGWWVSRRLVLRPVERLSEMARRLGAGDLGARARLRDGGELGQLGRAFDTMADELQRREVLLLDAQAELRRSNRALRVLHRVNGVVTHAQDRARLPQAICDAVVETGGYLQARVGEALHDEARTVKVLAQAGEDLLDEAWPAMRWDGSEHGLGPTGTAIRTGQTRLVRNVAADPNFGPWREQALRRGHGSVLAVPLRGPDQSVWGVLTIVAAEPDAFDAEEVALLEETASDLAFGIEALRAREDHRRAEQALADSEAKLRGILSSIDNLIWSLSLPGRKLRYLNPAAQRILGRPPEDFYRRPELWLEMVHSEDRALAAALFCEDPGVDAVQREYRIVRPDGEIRWLDSRLRLVRDAGGQVRRIDGVAADVTERKAYEQQVEYLATRDALTGLPNRRLLIDRIEQALAHVGHNQRTLAVAVVNLDRLKQINDSFGHAVGDRLLVAVGQRLRETMRGGDTVARLGGDEFAILADDLKRPDGALTAMAKAYTALTRPLSVDGHELHITASLGAAIYPGDGDGAEPLLQHAHAAMHRAKAEGGNGVQLYARQMSAEVHEKVRLEQALRKALLSGGELELHYQPQVDLVTGRVRGAEALARWRHPELGVVSPARFIPLAEETGLIAPVTEWALRTACTQMLAWRRDGLALERVAVNLSARHFWQGDVVGLVSRILAETGLPPRHLELEITESVVMRRIEDTVDALNELRALGVTVSLDDFGTGYSSLSYLRRLPLDKIKIDQSFVRDLAPHPGASLLVPQIIHIAHAMQCAAIAEGVETQAVADYLRQQGCDGAQGWHFSRPLAAQELADWLARAASPASPSA